MGMVSSLSDGSGGLGKGKGAPVYPEPLKAVSVQIWGSQEACSFLRREMIHFASILPSSKA